MKTITQYLKQISSIAALFYLISCAAIQGPPGGPKDKTPPELLETIPADGTILFEGGRVELVFSEYVDEKTVERAIRVLPTFETSPEIIYKGRRVFIEFPDLLSKDQTYIISIDRTLKDERNVAMGQGIQVAFATGNKIDEGKVSGSVTYEKASSAHLWKIKDEEDSTEFYQRIPDYVVDASDSGQFEFRFLSDGNYRLAAVDRSAAGLFISPERMLVGLPWVSVIQLGTEKEKRNMNIRIPGKIGGIKLSQAEWQTGNWSTITFSDKVKNIMSQLKIMALYEDSTLHEPEKFIDPLDEKKIHLILPKLGENRFITLMSDHIMDGENTLVDSGKIKVKVDTTRDTTYLSIKAPTKNFVLSIEEETINPFAITFSNLVKAEESNTAFTLSQDTIQIPFTVQWKSLIELELLPHENWHPNTAYTVLIHRDKIQPKFGKSLEDSVKTVSFKTSEFQGYGKLIVSTTNKDTRNLIAELTSMEKEHRQIRTVVNSDSIFEMDRLPDGNYSLMFFDDFDGNGNYSHGKIQPYQPSEWFFEYPDTVKIRSNWDLELNQINMEQYP